MAFDTLQSFHSQQSEERKKIFITKRIKKDKRKFLIILLHYKFDKYSERRREERGRLSEEAQYGSSEGLACS